MTTIEKAKNGLKWPALEKAAKRETAPLKEILANLSSGEAVLPNNRLRKIKNPCAIGKGLRTKINANIGTSRDRPSITAELKKLRIAEELGADTVMDLSASENLKKVRAEILKNSTVPLGTVPVYEAALLGIKKYGGLSRIPESFFIKVIEEQAKEGVDFFTIHAGVTFKTVNSLKSSNRIMGIVSRGGAILAEWMLKNSKENPFYALFDTVTDIAKDYDITLSLGDGMRPGALIDATDKPQIEELLTLGQLQQRAHKKGVQVIIEGPGHVPINQIRANVELEKSVCNGAPFYVLGPIVTDIAPGYDHITSAIGGAIAASYGADFLCYVTPAEHLRLPSIEDVREGVIAAKIAAHAADIAKNVPGAMEPDVRISRHRAAREWKKQFELALDSQKCKAYRKSSKPAVEDVCTMCSDYCSLKIGSRILDGAKQNKE